MNHGTRGRYNHGCRCDKCSEANRIYSREYLQRKARAHREMLLPISAGPTKHGTVHTYMGGCRCTRCKIAARDDRRNRRNGNKTTPVAPLPYAPLLERISSALSTPTSELNRYEIAAACGVSERTVTRWTESQQINARDADDIAIRLGWHPAAIWGADWYIATYDTGECA